MGARAWSPEREAAGNNALAALREAEARQATAKKPRKNRAAPKKVSDLCANCNGPRLKVEEPQTSDDHPFKDGLKGRKKTDAAVILAARVNDPFCSTQCAKEYHGVNFERSR